MSHLFPLMIPGATASAKTIEVVAPWDLSPIAQCETAGPDAIEHALNTAHKLYQDRDNWLPAHQRIAILEGTAQRISEQAESLALEAAREGGKPLFDSQVEVARAIDGLKNCAELLRSETGTEIPMGINPASVGRMAMTRKEPIGVVVAVSAFNHPFNLIVHQVGPAIAAGCPFIIKPAEDTPLSCFRLIELFHQAGLPEQWGQACLVDNHDTATALVTDARVGFFSFIGSGRVGWMLRSKLAAGTRCALEHGGAAPVIVDSSANMTDALPLLAKGGFYHAGQVCVSVQRIFAHEDIAADLAAGLTAHAVQMTVADPTCADSDIGPLIRPREVDRIHEWVTEAVNDGAHLLCGGKSISPTCYPPTVLYNPPLSSRVSTQEIFGPVICVYPYSDINAAIHQANSLPFAFQASVFSQNLDTALRCYRKLDASAVMVNDHTAFRVDWMPFAGLRQSGLGTGGIPYTYKDMSTEKMLLIRSQELT